MNNDHFYPRPEQERCQAQLRDCTGEQTVRLYCLTEGRDVLVCTPCAGTWRVNARAASLLNRCPRCALWHPGTRSHPASPAAQLPLSGDVANALDAAMHACGLLVDVRHQVLARLQRDAYWLTFIVAAREEAGA